MVFLLDSYEWFTSFICSHVHACMYLIIFANLWHLYIYFVYHILKNVVSFLSFFPHQSQACLHLLPPFMFHFYSFLILSFVASICNTLLNLLLEDINSLTWSSTLSVHLSQCSRDHHLIFPSVSCCFTWTLQFSSLSLAFGCISQFWSFLEN